MTLNNSRDLSDSSICFNHVIISRHHIRSIVVNRRIQRRILLQRRRIRIYRRRAQVDNLDTLGQIMGEQFINQMFDGSSFY
ncbi:hypothetical protein RCL_jg27386.t1 [Rhizophagus clarus]|uniref:Uncharacterized protein n=1 Tax=Rhizophagus clarus TaxID=94130 RepID=A0A8H3LX50_9GLOM|nr:hypothetical protein RCL_jg27386.t1 [Rhizophagus clarus]